ncbi:hypothetical protein L1987_46092 [Smallanthus sonchifolius]|uniref:Uncharacterized protein n=1 Tax=Smallanthus sonchifolius TaxID=185202 RepID=A0ACB9FZC3_9ASTR|nr:hypothetical protein L1987_46092 [Smallanthus sonchifolius]
MPFLNHCSLLLFFHPSYLLFFLRDASGSGARETPQETSLVKLAPVQTKKTIGIHEEMLSPKKKHRKLVKAYASVVGKVSGTSPEAINFYLYKDISGFRAGKEDLSLDSLPSWNPEDQATLASKQEVFDMIELSIIKALTSLADQSDLKEMKDMLSLDEE